MSTQEQQPSSAEPSSAGRAAGENRASDAAGAQPSRATPAALPSVPAKGAGAKDVAAKKPAKDPADPARDAGTRRGSPEESAHTAPLQAATLASAAAAIAPGSASRPGLGSATSADLPPLPPRPEPGAYAQPVMPPVGPVPAPGTGGTGDADTPRPAAPQRPATPGASSAPGTAGTPSAQGQPDGDPRWGEVDLGWAGATPPPAPRRADTGFQPELELEGSSYQTAPITSLAMARWSWAVVGLLIGAVLGVLSAGGGGYTATATIQVKDATNAGPASNSGTTLQALATSDAVLAIAVKSLRSGSYAQDYKRYGGALPAPGDRGDETDAKNYLGGGAKALWAADTNLVSVAVTRSVGGVAIVEANALAAAVQSKVQADADTHIAKLSTEYTRLLSGRSVNASGNPADIAEVQAIAQQYGADKASAAFSEKQSVQVIGTTTAYPAGANRTISALLGAAGGAFLGALAAVAAGAGRRRPHSPRELMALAPDLTVRTTVQAGELAGRVMETDRRCVVVLAMHDTRFAASQLAMAIAHHLRTHGATVALVDRVTEFAASVVSAEERLWALRRDVRRNIPANFSADLLVVVCNADEEALSLIAGQTDLLVAVVAKQRRSTLADIRRTVDAVQVSEPVVVLAR